MICVTAKMRSWRLLPPGHARAACRSARPAAHSGEGSRGIYARKHRGDQCQRDSKPHQAEVERQDRWRAPRTAPRSGPAPPPSEPPAAPPQSRRCRTAPGSSASSERRSTARARAQRRANRQFRLAPHRARQHQVGHVRAGNHKQQPRSRKQHPQNRVGARIDLVVHPRRRRSGNGLPACRPRDAPTVIARVHACVNSARACFERRARREPRKHLRHAVFAARAPSSPKDDAGWSPRWR